MQLYVFSFSGCLPIVQPVTNLVGKLVENTNVCAPITFEEIMIFIINVLDALLLK